jgi:hypothetical protein
MNKKILFEKSLFSDAEYILHRKFSDQRRPSSFDEGSLHLSIRAKPMSIHDA